MRVGCIVQPALQYGGWNVLIFSVQKNDGLHIRNKLNVTPYRGKLNVTAYGYLRTLIIASRENSEFKASVDVQHQVCQLNVQDITLLYGTHTHIPTYMLCIRSPSCGFP